MFHSLRTKSTLWRGVFMLFIVSLFMYSCEPDPLTLSDITKAEAEAQALHAAGRAGDAVALSNPGFESGETGAWTFIDPFAISGDANSGSKSGKITGSGGTFFQTVSVEANTNYTLSAYVLDEGTIGATVAGVDFEESGNYNNWTQVTVDFNTGSSTTVTIYGAYNGGEGRFDDFVLIEGQGSSSQRFPSMVGQTIRIENTASDLWLRVKNTNDFADAELVTQSNTGTLTRWVVEEVFANDTYYYRFVNEGASRRFRPETSGNGSKIYSGRTNWTGNWTQWEISSDGNGNYTFKNRSTGNYLNAGANTAAAIPTATTSTDGALTTWRIENLNGDDANSEVDPGTGPLDPNKAPSENFNLSQWKITLSSGDDIDEETLNNGYELANQFFTGSDGGMVFKNYPQGAGTGTTSGATQYSRVEFREMLRGSEDYWENVLGENPSNYPGTRGLNKNNWVFSTSSSSSENSAGGVDGVMEVTMKVDAVTSTDGSNTKVGRIVIGQIHASDHEPIRLYYKLMPGTTKGAIYFIHEDANQNEFAVNMIGTYAKTGTNNAGDFSGDSEPTDGIELGDVFSYKIEVVGNTLTVDLTRDGYPAESASYDMSSSGYANDWMYFKAGLYSQNDDTGVSSSDFEQVTIYSLNVSHD